MESHDYPIEHFKIMAELSIRLKSSLVLILEHHYHYESFGSWWFAFKQSGKKFRVVFDGRDNYLSLEPAVNVDKFKADWQSVNGKQLSDSGFDSLVLEVCFLIGCQS